MRVIVKRLTCVNRGDSEQNQRAISKIVDRYVQKMASKGWTVDESYRTAGNAYFRYEAYIRLHKGAK